MPHKTNTLSSEFSRVQQVRVPVTSDADILLARQHARELASEADFTAVEATFIATAISELGRNILQHAGGGEVSMKINQQEGGIVLIMVARDNGPGICDLDRALQDGFSTSGGLGLGLPGVRRLMDEFEIVSRQEHGTTVIAKKWARGFTGVRPARTARTSFKRRDGAAAGELAAVGSVAR
ncbi:MAG: ATP-binding protein [Terriglobia bacterium]|jgi:serine/threonine-protein kinase RsbT